MAAWQIRDLIGRRDVLPVEVTEHFLGRIHRRAGRVQWWEGLRRVFADSDLLCTTTIQHTAFTVERCEESWTSGLAEFALQWCAHTFPHSFLGWPALAAPCGLADGLPISLQITGPPAASR